MQVRVPVQMQKTVFAADVLRISQLRMNAEQQASCVLQGATQCSGRTGRSSYTCTPLPVGAAAAIPVRATRLPFAILDTVYQAKLT